MKEPGLIGPKKPDKDVVGTVKAELPNAPKSILIEIGHQALLEPTPEVTDDGFLSAVGYESEAALKLVEMINHALRAGRLVVEEADFPHLFKDEDVVEQETFHHLVDRYTFVLTNSDRLRLYRDIEIIENMRQKTKKSVETGE